MDIEQHRQEFNQRFANLVHMHRGECTIQDSEGNYPMTTTGGEVVCGLDAVREYHLAKLAEVEEEARKEYRGSIIPALCEEARRKERDRIFEELHTLFMESNGFEDRTVKLHTYIYKQLREDY
jgi:hypothetical protein